MLLGGAALLLLAVGGVLLGTGTVQTRLGVESEKGGPVARESGGIVASVAESVADLPEVWLATEDGDVLPADLTAAGVPSVAASEGPPATGYTRIPAPVPWSGPRRIGIQVGHWRTEDAPPELSRLVTETGASWGAIAEIEINLDIATRLDLLLVGMGFLVDLLPTTIAPGYVADAVVALHADSDGTGETSGFKAAHSYRRTPYEAALLESIEREYASATGLPYDAEGVSRGMRSYYLFSWQRTRYATAPHTPSVILEMGFLSHDGDRALLTERPDLVAGAIASGIRAFLEAHSRDTLFGEDLLVPLVPQFRAAPPSASP